MCNFYKKMNGFFKEIFVLIFLVGVFGAVFGILYSLYELIFNNTTNPSDSTFIIQYIFMCLVSILVGIVSINGDIKNIKNMNKK